MIGRQNGNNYTFPGGQQIGRVGAKCQYIGILQYTTVKVCIMKSKKCITIRIERIRAQTSAAPNLENMKQSMRETVYPKMFQSVPCSMPDLS